MKNGIKIDLPEDDLLEEDDRPRTAAAVEAFTACA